MTNRVPDKVINWAEAQAQLAADTDKNPQFAAMAKATQRTKDEQAQVDAADAKVAEAEATVNAAGLALNQARGGIEPGYDRSQPMTFFQKSPARYRAAREALPGLQADLGEAQIARQNAIRRRNQTIRDVDRARAERRLLAKLKHAPKLAPVQTTPDWGSLATLARLTGGKDA